uniref:Uncharacterized protein n=1 Tax=Hyaloperonospora arabidopsidis (strain Emoy2) TaxID=559515 RepID=M4BSF7_HYAAE
MGDVFFFVANQDEEWPVGLFALRKSEFKNGRRFLRQCRRKCGVFERDMSRVNGSGQQGIWPVKVFPGCWCRIGCRRVKSLQHCSSKSM